MSLGLLLLLWETIVEDALEVGLLPGVFLLVILQACCLCVGLWAAVTDVGLLITVRQLVGLEVSCC